MVGVGILLAGVMLGRVAVWLGQNSGVALASNMLGVIVALAAASSSQRHTARQL